MKMSGENFDIRSSSTCADGDTKDNLLLGGRKNLGIFGGVNRSGLGDMASNLYVAKQIAALNPDLNVVVFLSDEAVSDYQKLVFGFDPDAKRQTHYGLTFLRGDAVDGIRCDKFMGFSMGNPRMINADTNRRMIDVVSGRIGKDVREMIGGYRFYSEYGGDEDLTDLFSTGLHALYISPKKPDALPRDELDQLVQDRTGIDLRGKRIAFSYGHELQRKLYAGFFNAPDIVVFSDRFVEDVSRTQAKIVAPPLDLFLSEQLIAHADFPVCVTGDVSVSMALQHEKPFKYRGRYWKVPFGNAVARYFGVETMGSSAEASFRVASGGVSFSVDLDKYNKFRETRAFLSIHNTRLADIYVDPSWRQLELGLCGSHVKIA